MNGLAMDEVPFPSVRTRRRKSRCLAGACEREFDCKELETLFQKYNLKLEQTATLKALAILILAAFALALVELLSAGSRFTMSKGSHPVHCVIFTSLFIVTNVKYLQVTQLQQIARLALLFSFTFALLCCPFPLVLGYGSQGAQGPDASSATPEQGVWQLMLVTFVAYSLLPVRTLFAVLFGILVAASHFIVTATSVTARRSRVWTPLVANAVLLVGVNLSGVFVRVLTERAQRKAFLQARNCIQQRLQLEDENEKQQDESWLVSALGVGLERSSPVEQAEKYSPLVSSTHSTYVAKLSRGPIPERHALDHSLRLEILNSKTQTDVTYHIRALASVYTPVASKTATQTYLSELKDIAKHTGKDFTAVLREELSIISESVDLDQSETQDEDIEQNSPDFPGQYGPENAAQHLTPESPLKAYLEILDSAFGTVEDGDDLFAKYLNTMQDNSEKPSAYLQRLQVMLNTLTGIFSNSLSEAAGTTS
ncbi:adenylate cyclase type 1-like [Carassius gibelio]|uniref:adenylate cyclase type 1-like n=1 Tax=Carassius gibelio TaxID=101364 RepID=UPI0022778E31|nr:adenylate cyclase type 1-like [Carassius gibelio]